MDILMTAARTLLLPLAYVCLAARTASAALDSPAIDGASKLITKVTGIATTAIMTAFTAWLGITGAVSGAAGRRDLARGQDGHLGGPARRGPGSSPTRPPPLWRARDS